MKGKKETLSGKMSKVAVKAAEKHAEAPREASGRQKNANTGPGALKIIHSCHYSHVGIAQSLHFGYSQETTGNIAARRQPRAQAQHGHT